MQTLSRGYICSYCGKSAEDENGNFTVFAPNCNDPECIRANEPNHWHMTYAVISCNKCAKERENA